MPMKEPVIQKPATSQAEITKRKVVERAQRQYQSEDHKSHAPFQQPDRAQRVRAKEEVSLFGGGDGRTSLLTAVRLVVRGAGQNCRLLTLCKLRRPPSAGRYPGSADRPVRSRLSLCFAWGGLPSLA